MHNNSKIEINPITSIINYDSHRIHLINPIKPDETKSMCWHRYHNKNCIILKFYKYMILDGCKPIPIIVTHNHVAAVNHTNSR